MKALLAIACVLLTGCASLSESECRSANWHQIGERDSLVYGLRPQIDHHAHRCRAFGVQADEKEYMVGWNDGQMERRQRMDFGGGPD